VNSVVAQEPLKISGVVSDSNGAAIANASVEFESNQTTVRTQTDVAGNFTLLSTRSYGTLSIRSPGFNTMRIEVSTASEPLHIKLEPAAVIERILITDTDERISSTPTSQFAITQKEISVSGALTIDDVLRQVPGFSLFRRSGKFIRESNFAGCFVERRRREWREPRSRNAGWRAFK
jgi:outer membrane receptor for Fe3+-dicitrate